MKHFCFYDSFRLRDLPEKNDDKLETVVERILRLREQQNLGPTSISAPSSTKQSPARVSEIKYWWKKLKKPVWAQNITFCKKLILEMPSNWPNIMFTVQDVESDSSSYGLMALGRNYKMVQYKSSLRTDNHKLQTNDLETRLV